jgi:hypothetical protein
MRSNNNSSAGRPFTKEELRTKTFALPYAFRPNTSTTTTAPPSAKRARGGGSSKEEETEGRRAKRPGPVAKGAPHLSVAATSSWVCFSSGAREPLRFLSNFSDALFTVQWPADVAAIPPALRGRRATYRTAENAFQALRACNLESARAFEIDGLLSNLDAAFSFFPVVTGRGAEFTRVDMRDVKTSYWGARRCSGILPKMVADLPPQVSKAAFGLDLVATHAPGAASRNVWLPILMAKFTQSAPHRHALLGTGNAPLVEQGRFPDPKQFWSAYVDRVTDRLVGTNRMGVILGDVRARLRLLHTMTPRPPPPSRLLPQYYARPTVEATEEEEETTEAPAYDSEEEASVTASSVAEVDFDFLALPMQQRAPPMPRLVAVAPPSLPPSSSWLKDAEGRGGFQGPCFEAIAAQEPCHEYFMGLQP